MNLVWGYDLDGVLAVGPPPPDKKWGRMKGPERAARKAALVQHYAEANVLHDPKAIAFHVITARKLADDGVHAATQQWLHRAFGNARVLSLSMFTGSRNIPDVVAFKARYIRAYCITDFVEDNVTVVRGLRKELGKGCRVWLYKDGNYHLEG